VRACVLRRARRRVARPWTPRGVTHAVGERRGKFLNFFDSWRTHTQKRDSWRN